MQFSAKYGSVSCIAGGLLCMAASATAIEYSAPGSPYKIRVFNAQTDVKVCVTKRNKCDLPAGEYYVKLIDEDGRHVGRIDGIVLGDGGLSGGGGTTEVASIEDLLGELGCEPGQQIEATTTDDWRCVSTCPANIQSLWTYVTNPDLITPPVNGDEVVASSSDSVIIGAPRTSADFISRLLPGECSVSVDQFYLDSVGNSMTLEPIPSGGHTFTATIPGSAVTVSYENDLGGRVVPKEFPIEDAATIKACALMFGCPSGF